MQDDPWSRRRTVKVISISDMILAVLLITYAVIRITNYEYKDQSIVYFMYREQHIFFSLVYWILNFAFLSLQLVFAFLLLTATIDMTLAPQKMISKCILWRSLSILFFVMLFIELLIVLYELLMNGLVPNIFKAVVNSLELVFRAYGVFFVGRFIGDLNSLFDAPMVQYGKDGIIPPSPKPILKRTYSKKFKEDSEERI